MNQITNGERAQILVQALPNLQHYHGRTVVVKYGGNAMASPGLEEQVMEDVVLLWEVGIHVVLVHGGGPAISRMMEKLGKKPVFVDGLRVTDEETMQIVKMVLAGDINKSLVSLLEKKGGRAVGLSGMDDGLIEAVRKNEKLGCVGEVKAIHTGLLTDLLSQGYIPVISTIGLDKEGNALNINGDTAAGAIAQALGAERLIMMSDVSGVLEDVNDPSSLIRSLTLRKAQELSERGVFQGGMIPKARCCMDAVEHGVKAAVILDGTVPHALLMELLTSEGAGTMITKG